jgi:hypothetical protein
MTFSSSPTAVSIGAAPLDCTTGGNNIKSMKSAIMGKTRARIFFIKQNPLLHANYTLNNLLLEIYFKVRVG